jgi:hypothetical protein
VGTTAAAASARSEAVRGQLTCREVVNSRGRDAVVRWGVGPTGGGSGVRGRVGVLADGVGQVQRVKVETGGGGRAGQSHGRDAIGGLWVLEEGLEVEGVVGEGGVEGALEQSGLHFDGGGWMHNRDVGEAIKRHWNTRGALRAGCYDPAHNRPAESEWKKKKKKEKKRAGGGRRR